jgi:peptide deformylase
MKLALVNTPNPILNQPTKPVKKFDKRLSSIISEMKRILVNSKNPQGVGLAGPQVGLALKIFIIKPYPNSKISVFINPEITETAKEYSHRKDALEGCLSIKNIWGVVNRPKWVILKYQDSKGNTFVKKFTGWEAQIIQHEIDHLSGILFTNRVLEQQQKLYQIEKNKQGEEELVPLEI